MFSFVRPEISADEAENRLQDAIQEKFAVFGDVSMKDFFLIDSVLLVFIPCYVAPLSYKKHIHHNEVEESVLGARWGVMLFPL